MSNVLEKLGDRVWVSLDVIERDGSTQGRVNDDAVIISEYSGVLDEAWDKLNAEVSADAETAEFELQAWPFPAVVLFLDKSGRYWVGDGFHRIGGASASEFYGVVADVRAGGVKDALKYALGANAQHGLRRSSEDLERCVELASMEYPEMSDRAIAELVGCSPSTVAKYRPEGAKMDSYETADGRVVKRTESQEAGLPDGMDDGPVNEGSEGYVDDEPVREDVVAVESGSVKSNGGMGSDAVRGYDVAYVALNDVPSIAEVMPWVVDVPTWLKLLDGCDVPMVRMRDEAGEVKNMVKRDAVLAWCSAEVDERLEMRGGKKWNLEKDRWWRAEDGEVKVRWDGFRSKPVSLEHAERERERWQGEQRRGELVEWLKDLALGLSKGAVRVDYEVLIAQVRKMVPRESVELVERAVKDLSKDEDWGVWGEHFEVILLLLATPLLSKGVEHVEGEFLNKGEGEV